MKTEYLILIDTKDNICVDQKAFESLLKLDNRIEINQDKLIYKNRAFKYKNQTKQITDNSTYRYFHIIFELPNITEIQDVNDEILLEYEEMLRIIRKLLGNFKATIEVLWDDVSMFYSTKSYPMIYKIENLMRKLLTKFMLINVGLKWENKNVPSKISESRNNSKTNLNKSILYKLDFKELAPFLFDNYVIADNNELKKLVNNKVKIESKELEPFIPASNWERYFKSIVNVDGEHLKKEWNELYELRCKIAHNNLLVREDYTKINNIINDIQPYIEEAIEKLDSIEIEEDLKERLTENFAIKSIIPLHDFLKSYTELMAILFEFADKQKEFSDIKHVPDSQLVSYAYNANLIDRNEYSILKRFTYNRNQWVHLGPIEPDDNEIEKEFDEINRMKTVINQRLKGDKL